MKNMCTTIVYIDESGDLGFDFTKKGTSKYLVLTALVCADVLAAKTIHHAVRKTLTWENKRRKKGHLSELKGSKTSIDVKRYFFRHLGMEQNWGIYTVVADKKRLVQSRRKINCNSFYNEVLLKLLKTISYQEIYFYCYR